MLLDFETKSATFCEKFLSLIDCLITPKHEVQELGDFDVETVPLLALVSFGKHGAETSSCNTSQNQGC